jgi:hypothetical protein
MRFSLIHPSRGRPQQAIQTAKKWIEKSGGDVEWILSLDTSDSKKFDYLELSTGMDLKVTMNDNDCVVQATNHAAKLATGDVLIYLSDDFDCPDNWAQLLEHEIKTHIPSSVFLIKVDDCLQKFEVPVLTIPIMSKELYNTLGYFWHPDYKSMFCDCDLYEVVKRNGWLRYARHLKFEHKHPSVGKAPMDETYKKSEGYWKQGERLFEKRRLQGFPL